MRDVIEFGQLRTQGLAGLARPTKIVGFPQPALQDPAFQAALRAMRFPVVNNYLNDLLGGRDLGSAPRSIALGAYLDTPAPPADSVNALEMVLEAGVPRAVLDRIDLPQSLGPTRHPRFFAGRQGSCADMHFDWLSHWLFQVPLIGRKHFAFLPITAASALDVKANFARRNLRDLSLDDWSALVAEHDGCHFILGPGEALVQPPFWWHCVTYLEPAATVSIGVGEVDPVIDAIVAEPGPRDWKLAALFNARLHGGAQAQGPSRMVDAMHVALKAKAAQRVG